jgi:ERF superfamily
MSQSNEINELAAALSKCQSELKPVPKATKGHFKGGYADLTDCWENCREALTKNGLSVSQQIDEVNDRIVMHTTLLHSSGQWISSTMPIICKTPDDIQKIGSSLTYTRRYMLCSILGISPTEDDDGNEAKAPPTSLKINRDMIIELNTLLDDCGEEYSNQIMTTLKSFNPPIRSFEDLPIQLYDRIKAAAIKEKENKQVKNESV